MGVTKANEYGVLECAFKFWQYGSRPESIPTPDAPTQALADEIRRVNTMYFYSDAGTREYQSFIYQAFTETGYYNYDTADFRPYLKANPNPTNLDFLPANTRMQITYDPRTLAWN